MPGPHKRLFEWPRVFSFPFPQKLIPESFVNGAFPDPDAKKSIGEFRVRDGSEHRVV